jgi:hypothetical protein
MPIQIACIVEGHGECESVPILIRRIAQDLDPGLAVLLPRPIRKPKSALLRPRELERAVEFASMRAGGEGGILVILDSDDDCPAQLAPNLLDRVPRARGDLPCAVVLANKEFESWFLASAHSLRGHRGLPQNLDSPAQPETIRGAKEWLAQRAANGSYSPAVDQASLTAVFDLHAARLAPSFDKCYREIAGLLEVLRDRAGR